MDTEAPQATTGPGRRGLRPRAVLLLGALLALPALVAAVPALAVRGDATKVGRLDADLAQIAKLNNRGVRPPAQRLAHELPEDAKRLGELREPAATARDQAGVALDELREMSAPATLNPHYLPALVAAGRAFLAAGGQDPVTRTPINPAYLGLEAELALREASLQGSAADADRPRRPARLGRHRSDGLCPAQRAAGDLAATGADPHGGALAGALAPAEPRPRGTVAEPERLAAISRWQDRVARDPAVEAMIGPASLGEAESALAGARRAYRAAPERRARVGRGRGGGAARLARGLRQLDETLSGWRRSGSNAPCASSKR